jgi:hypothetical protein
MNSLQGPVTLLPLLTDTASEICPRSSTCLQRVGSPLPLTQGSDPNQPYPTTHSTKNACGRCLPLQMRFVMGTAARTTVAAVVTRSSCAC